MLPGDVGPAGWRRLPGLQGWRGAVMVLAWLGVIGLFFLAPALLPLAVALLLGVGRLRGVWKKRRH